MSVSVVRWVWVWWLTYSDHGARSYTGCAEGDDAEPSGRRMDRASICMRGPWKDGWCIISVAKGRSILVGRVGSERGFERVDECREG